MRFRRIVPLAVTLVAASGCQSSFSYVGQKIQSLATQNRPADQLDLSGAVALPAGVSSLTNSSPLTNADPLANVTPLTNVSPLTNASPLIGNSGSGLIGNSGSGLIGNSGSGLIGNSGSGLIGNSGAGYRILDLGVGVDSDHHLEGTKVEVIDPSSGRVLQVASTGPDGSYALSIRLANAPKGLIIETVLSGAAGPIGYLAAPLKAPPVTKNNARQVDLTEGSTSFVYSAMELAGMNKSLNLNDVSTRQNAMLEKLLARLDDKAAVAAAARTADAYGMNRADDLGSANSAALSTSQVFSVRAYQGMLRFGGNLPTKVSQEGLIAAFLNKIDNQIQQAPAASDSASALDQTALSVVASVSYSDIVSTAASIDYEVEPLPPPTETDGATSTVDPSQLGPGIPLPTPIASDGVAVPTAAAQ